MTEVSTREVLQELAELPIGSVKLQEECDAIAHIPAEAKPAMSAELRETIKRTRQIWLPSGKRTVSRADAKAAEQAFYAKQVDLEDAGGKRGGQ